MAEAALEKFSADFLTERLRASGVLPRGRVIAVDAGERYPAIISTAAPLQLEYSSDAPQEAPTRLFLKATRGGLDPGLRSIGEREVTFYRHAAPLMPGGPIPRCYDAEYADGSFHLLLDDLSQTHTTITTWPLPPSDEACERIIDTWASFHAFWWRHPSLGRGLGTFLDESALLTITAEYGERYARFARTLDDRLWPAARAIYTRVQQARERLITPERLYATYTLGHGDAHVWNLLYPRDGVAARIVLIDWDGWRIGRAAAISRT